MQFSCLCIVLVSGMWLPPSYFELNAFHLVSACNNANAINCLSKSRPWQGANIIADCLHLFLCHAQPVDIKGNLYIYCLSLWTLVTSFWIFLSEKHAKVYQAAVLFATSSEFWHKISEKVTCPFSHTGQVISAYILYSATLVEVLLSV